MDMNFGHYLAGLIDGEGCFMLNKQTQHKHLSVFYYPRFALHMRADEMPILLQIKEFLGVGNVYTSEATHKNPMAVYQIDSGKDCVALVKILDICPLRAKKLDEYKIWRTCVLLKQQKPRHSYLAIGFDELRRLKSYKEGSETIISAPVRDEGIVRPASKDAD